MESNLPIWIISQYDDDYDEQYEDYCRHYEEEEIWCVDGFLPKYEDDEFYIPEHI